MKEKSTKNITNEHLAELINNLRGEIKAVKETGDNRMTLYKRMELEIMNLKEEVGGFRIELRDLRNIADRLEDGALTNGEKEEVLNMIRNIDKRLEEETLGKDKITLTRSEYNGVAKTVGFENKFEKVGE